MSDSSIVGQIALELGIDTRSLTRQLTQATYTADKKLTSGFSGIGKKIGGILGGLALGAFAKDCIDLGSDLSEVQNVVDTSFKSMSSYVNSFAKDAMKNFGLSETVAKQYMGTIGAMNNAFGFSETASYDMAQAVTGLAGDVASFYNLSSDEAFTKLKSIWTGETESLKDLGVVLTQTNLDQYAMNNGFGKTTAKMTEQEKVMLRFQYVTSCLSDAAGDFVKTQDSWANQTRVLSLQFDSLKATLGQGFINLFTPLIKGLNNLLAKLSQAAEGFKGFTEVITGKTAVTESLGNIAGSAAQTAGSVDNITASAKEAKKALAGFDKITKLSDTTGTGDSGGETSSGTITTPNTDGTEQTTGEMSAFTKSILNALEPLKNISFDNLKQSLDGLKKSLEPLGKTVFDGLKWGYDNILVPLAEWTIEDALPAFLDVLSGAFDTLNEVLEFLKPIWEWTWENFFEPLAEWTGGIVVGVLEDLADCLSAVARNKNAIAMISGLTSALLVYEVGKKGHKALTFLTDKLTKLGTFGKIALVVSVAFTGLEVGESIYSMITGDKEDYRLSDLFDSDWEDIKAGIDMTVDDFQVGMDLLGESCGSGIDGIIQYFSDCTEEIYTCWIEPVKENAVQLWEDIKSVFSEAVLWFSSKFSAAWEGIKEAWSSVTGFFGDIWMGIKTAFSTAGTWFGNKFTDAVNGIKGAFGSISDFFGNVWDGIKSAFGNVTEWFRNTFSDAWQAVKDVFSKGGRIFEGIVSGIAENFKNVVNAIIRGINKVIAFPFKKINGMLNDIREISIMGIEPFKGLWGKNPLPTPEIPQLAQGGYVKANTPQLAMIGDNRHQGEVVAPEDKLTEMALAAVKAAGGNSYSVEILKVLKQILVILNERDLNIVIDGKKLKDIIVQKINEHTRQTGVCEIIN